MPHDHHFLSRLDRVTREQTDLALTLYRDHELVRYLLEKVKVPEGAERIALSIEDPREGPFIVVTRDGHFVTCLGKSMSSGGLPIVPRTRIEGVMAKMEDLRARREAANKFGDEQNLIRKVLVAGQYLSREDFTAATAIVPAVFPTLLNLYFELGENIDEIHNAFIDDVPWAGDKDLLRDLWRATWAMGNLVVLMVAGGDRAWAEKFADVDRGAPAAIFSPLTVLQGAAFAARSAWAAARIGKPMLAAYKARYLGPTTEIMFHDAAWALQAMRLRHASLTAECTKTFTAAPNVKTPYVEQIVSSLRTWHGIIAQTIIDKRDEWTALATKMGRMVTSIYSRAAPAGSPWRFDTEEQVPDDLATPGLFTYLGDTLSDVDGLQTMANFMPIIARAKPEEMFYPEAFVRAANGPFDETNARYLIDMRKKWRGKPQTYRAEKKPGRNEACTCGSGKKYKKCCGR